MAKRGMNRDGEHPPVTKNKKKLHAQAYVPELQGKEKTGKQEAEDPNPPPKDER